MNHVQWSVETVVVLSQVAMSVFEWLFQPPLTGVKSSGSSNVAISQGKGSNSSNLSSLPTIINVNSTLQQLIEGNQGKTGSRVGLMMLYVWPYVYNIYIQGYRITRWNYNKQDAITNSYSYGQAKSSSLFEPCIILSSFQIVSWTRLTRN